MPREPETSKIDPTGLRYKSKAGGSPFGTNGGTGTMSCYKCGLHKPRALGSYRKFLNQQMFVCGDCRPVPTESSPASAPTRSR